MNLYFSSVLVKFALGTSGIDLVNQKALGLAEAYS